MVILTIFGQDCSFFLVGEEDKLYPTSTVIVATHAAAYGNDYFAVVGDVEWTIPRQKADVDPYYGGACTGTPSYLGNKYRSGYFCISDDSFQEAQVGFPTTREAFTIDDFPSVPGPVLPIMNDVCFGEGKFVAIGDYDRPANKEIWVHDLNAPGFNPTVPRNGWTKVYTDYDGSIYNIAYGGGWFLAAGYGQVLLSPDATRDSWSFSDYRLGASNMPYFVANGAGRFVAVTWDKAAWSQDPSSTNWVPVEVADSNFKPRAITYGNNRFVIVGLWGRIWWSFDGTEGTRVDASIDTVNYDCDIAYFWLCPGNGSFIIGGYDYDNHCKRWWCADENLENLLEIHPFSETRSEALAYGNNMYIAIDSAWYVLSGTEDITSDGLVVSSIDGSPGSWTVVDPGPELIIPENPIAE